MSANSFLRSRGTVANRFLGSRGITSNRFLGRRGITAIRFLGSRGISASRLLGSGGITANKFLGRRGITANRVLGRKGITANQLLGSRRITAKWQLESRVFSLTDTWETWNHRRHIIGEKGANANKTFGKDKINCPQRFSIERDQNLQYCLFAWVNLREVNVVQISTKDDLFVSLYNFPFWRMHSIKDKKTFCWELFIKPGKFPEQFSIFFNF